MYKILAREKRIRAVHAVIHFVLHANPLLLCILVAVVLLLESSAVPIANNTLLLLTGALASTGQLNIVLLFLAAFLGSVAGACLAYRIGLSGGRRVVLRIAAILHIDAQKVVAAERWYERSGPWMIFLSRMTPYIRPFACFPAGITGMNFFRFLGAAATGSFLWCLALLSLGWWLGQRWRVALHLMQQYTLPAIALLVILIVAYFVGRRVLKRRRHAFS